MTEMSIADHDRVVDTVCKTNITGVATATALDVVEDIADDFISMTITDTSLITSVRVANSDRTSINFTRKDGSSELMGIRISPAPPPRRLSPTSASARDLKPRLINLRRVGAASATKANVGDSKFEGATTKDAHAYAKSFTLFPQLPSELRLKVWRFACASAQEFQITVSRDRLSSTVDYGNGDGVCDIGMYRANHESRDQVLRLNGPLFALPTGDCVRLVLDTVYFNISQLDDSPMWTGGTSESDLFQLVSRNLSLIVQFCNLPSNDSISNPTSRANSSVMYTNLVLTPTETHAQAKSLGEALDKIFADEEHPGQIKKHWLDMLWECQKYRTQEMMFLSQVKLREDGWMTEATQVVNETAGVEFSSS